MSKLVRGILPALVTPFDNDLELDIGRVEPLIQKLLESDIGGFFVCGGTGEGRVMTVPERKRMGEAAVKTVSGRVPVILHVGGTTTEDAVELAAHAPGIGADAVASVAPADRPNDLAAAVTHYTAIGGASDLPFYVYWLASDADRSVTAGQFLEAMAGVPNFAGIKFTDTNFYLFQQLVDLSEGMLNAITGPDEMCAAGMIMGSDGAIGSTYNIMPEIYSGMYRAFQEGRIQDVMSAQVNANKVISTLISYGVLAGIKAMLGWRGVPVGPPRPPNNRMTVGEESSLRAAIDAFDFEVE
jgi:N-acetylneuraminate lyase